LARKLSACLDAVERRLDAAALERFRSGLQGVRESLPEPATRAAYTPHLPVERHWPGALERAALIDRELADALDRLSPAFTWRQNPNYVRRPPSRDFLPGYGYAVIAGPGGLVPAGMAMGVLLLGPGILYPAHAHPAEEVYLVLDDASRWWRDGADWQSGLGGVAIHHPPNLAHAMQAGSVPLCALYLWRGDLATHAALTQPRDEI
jgi:hypothetical protein